MLVRSAAHIRREDMCRILKKAEVVPGDVCDLPDALAEVYLKNGWVVRVAEPATAAPEGITDAVEFAAGGAPEKALSRRGRSKPV